MLVDFRWSGSENPGHMWFLETWFSEGLSGHVAGGSWAPIRTLDEMNAWRAQPDHGNPISIREWSSFPSSVIDRTNGFEYYPMFDLAVRYLLDGAGLGGDLRDVMAMFRDMEAGTASFASAFQEHMAISVAEYEEWFFVLMVGYLPPG
jgi:hypothetical protein